MNFLRNLLKIFAYVFMVIGTAALLFFGVNMHVEKLYTGIEPIEEIGKVKGLMFNDDEQYWVVVETPGGEERLLLVTVEIFAYYRFKLFGSGGGITPPKINGKKISPFKEL